MDEEGENNLYALVANNGIDNVDHSYPLAKRVLRKGAHANQVTQ